MKLSLFLITLEITAVCRSFEVEESRLLVEKVDVKPETNLLTGNFQISSSKKQEILPE
jgi:hypothetical protein